MGVSNERFEWGKNARKSGTFHDLSWTLQYIPSADGDEEALAFCRTSSLQRQNPRVCVVALSAAYKYAVDTYLIKQSLHFAQYMGLESRHDVHRIADFLTRMLIELVTMKPAPEGEDDRPTISVLPDGSFHIEGHERGLRH